MKKLIRIIRLLNLPCDEVVRLVSQSFDDDLPWDERAAIRSHLVYCKACRRFRRQMAMLRDLLDRYIEQPHLADRSPEAFLSDDARERIKRTLSPPSE